jgi:hypothetical protein
MKKKPSTTNATRVASKDCVVFAPVGFLCVTRRHKTPCKFNWQTIDGCLDGLVEVEANPEFVEAIAFSWRPTVQVELFDLEFGVQKKGYNKCKRTLYPLASSFFSGIARALDRRSYRGGGVDVGPRRRCIAKLQEVQDYSPQLSGGKHGKE